MYGEIEFYGRNGTRVAGRLAPDVEDAAYQLMWLWANENSIGSQSQVHQDYWYVHGSENHHVQGFTAAWSFSRLLAKDPKYRDTKYEDGHTVAEHYAAWTEFAKDYIAERARKGLFIEAATPYNISTLKGICDFHDFADDPELRRRAGLLLTLYWATWAQEQLDGVRAGGKTRIYPSHWSTNGDDSLRRLAWYYFGIGSKPSLGQEELAFLTSGFRLPPIVLDLALHPDKRGVYEIDQWPMGLAVPGFYKPKDYRIESEAAEFAVTATARQIL